MTCFNDIDVVSFAPTGTVLAMLIPFRAIVKVAEEALVLVTKISLTTVVVADGTVYRVTDDVDPAPLKSAFVVVGICCSLS